MGQRLPVRETATRHSSHHCDLARSHRLAMSIFSSAGFGQNVFGGLALWAPEERTSVPTGSYFRHKCAVSVFLPISMMKPPVQFDSLISSVSSGSYAPGSTFQRVVGWPFLAISCKENGQAILKFPKCRGSYLHRQPASMHSLRADKQALTMNNHSVLVRQRCQIILRRPASTLV
jgi:hypothetical protein